MRSLSACTLLAFTFLGAAALGLRADDDEPETPLRQQMKVIDDGLKKLRKDLQDPAKNADSLKRIAEMETAALFCKLETPPKSAKIPEAERAAFVTAYRKELVNVVRLMLDLETALLDGDNAKAQELRKKLHDAEDPGHEKFAEDG